MQRASLVIGNTKVGRQVGKDPRDVASVGVGGREGWAVCLQGSGQCEELKTRTTKHF